MDLSYSLTLTSCYFTECTLVIGTEFHFWFCSLSTLFFNLLTHSFSQQISVERYYEPSTVSGAKENEQGRHNGGPTKLTLCWERQDITGHYNRPPGWLGKSGAVGEQSGGLVLYRVRVILQQWNGN